MSKTAFSTSDALTKKLWEEKLFKDTMIMSYFNRFMAETADNIVTVNTKLDGNQGDTVTIGIRMRLSGAGVNANQTLEGNEEKLTTYSTTVTLQEYAHAVRDAGPLDRQRVAFSIDEESVAALKVWGAEKIDKLCFDALNASNTKTFYGDGTGKASLTTAGKLTPALISKIKAAALTGLNRSQTPLRPVRVDGKDYYVLLVHPDVGYDLFQDTNFTAARQYAELRGSDNPLFTGAKMIWNGVVVHEHERIPIGLDAGSGANVPYADCLFMGAQSLVWAWGKRPVVVAEEFDYGREHGYAWSMLGGTKKPTFNSKDYGSFGVMVARTKIADA